MNIGIFCEIKYLAFGTDIHGNQQMNLNDFGDPFDFSCRNSSRSNSLIIQLNMLTSTRWIGTKFGTDICVCRPIHPRHHLTILVEIFMFSTG